VLGYVRKPISWGGQLMVMGACSVASAEILPMLYQWNLLSWNSTFYFVAPLLGFGSFALIFGGLQNFRLDRAKGGASMPKSKR
jgi:hypothetical protein